jgi:ATP-dependent helicase/DNAse subunit B
VITSSNSGFPNTELKETCVKANIELILGSYRSGKTDRILNTLLKDCQSNELAETIIVVPSERYKSLLDKRIFKLWNKNRTATGKDLGQPIATAAPEHATFDTAPILKGIVGLRLLTFYQYCELILNRFGIVPRILPDSVRLQMIRLLLEDENNKGLTKSLSGVAGYPGTAKAVLELIDELQRSALSSDDTIKRLEATAGQDAPQLEYARLYKRYWEALKQIDYIDKHHLAYQLRELSFQPVPTWAPVVVAFEGFDRFNPLQLQVVSASARLARQVFMSFDYLPSEEDENGEYEWKRKTFQQLTEILGPQLNIQSIKPEKGASAKTIQAFSSADRYLEMAQIAALVKEAMIKRKVKADEILVVTRRIGEYAEAADAAFADAGIDCFIDNPLKLDAFPLVKFLRTFFSLAEENFSRAQVIYCWQSQYFKRQEIGLSYPDTVRLDKESRQEKVIGTKEQWLSIFREPSIHLKDGVDKFFRIWEEAPDFCSAVDYVGWLEDLLDQFLVLPDRDSAIDPYHLWQTRAAMIRIRACFASLLMEENVMRDLGRTVEKKTSAHLERLISLIETTNFASVATSKEQVLVCGAELAPNRSYEEVYIAGLVEGEFPKRSVPSGLLTSDQVALWESFGIELHNPRFEPGFELALLADLQERARKRIVLSTPLFDMSGEELTPAFYFSEQTESATTQILDGDHFGNQRSLPTSARGLLSSILWSSPQEARSLSKYGHPLVLELADNLSEALVVSHMRASREVRNVYNGFLKDLTEAGALSITLPEFFSASQFGQYGRCPHQYWLSNLIKAKALEEPEEGLNDKECGTAYHNALEIFFANLIETHKSIADLSDTELEELTMSSIDKALEKEEKRSSFRPGAFWFYQKREIAFRLRQFLLREHERARLSGEQFRPVALECKFGYEETAPPLRMPVQEDLIPIRGRIDRIDEEVGLPAGSTRKFRVVDYKRGTTSLQKDLKTGIELQLPIYALAVERSLFQGARVVAGEYLSVHARKPVGSLFPKRKKANDDGEHDPLTFAEEKISEFVSGIKQGIFTVKPAETKVCDYCEHKTICRINELLSLKNESEGEDGTD